MIPAPLEPEGGIDGRELRKVWGRGSKKKEYWTNQTIPVCDECTVQGSVFVNEACYAVFALS